MIRMRLTFRRYQVIFLTDRSSVPNFRLNFNFENLIALTTTLFRDGKINSDFNLSSYFGRRILFSSSNKRFFVYFYTCETTFSFVYDNFILVLKMFKHHIFLERNRSFYLRRIGNLPMF